MFLPFLTLLIQLFFVHSTSFWVFLPPSCYLSFSYPTFYFSLNSLHSSISLSFLSRVIPFLPFPVLVPICTFSFRTDQNPPSFHFLHMIRPFFVSLLHPTQLIPFLPAPDFSLTSSFNFFLCFTQPCSLFRQYSETFTAAPPLFQKKAPV